MAKNQTLLELQTQKLCDEETVRALSEENPFIQKTIEGIAQGYEAFIENRTAPGETKDAIHEFGNTLLFLENLVDEPTPVQDKVQEWLQDEKRTFLLTHSPQGELYGRLLVAKAKEELHQFREEYNEGIPAQTPFTLEETLTLTLQDNPRAKAALPLEKLNTLLADIRNNAIGDIRKKVDACLDMQTLQAIHSAKSPELEKALDYLEIKDILSTPKKRSEESILQQSPQFQPFVELRDYQPDGRNPSVDIKLTAGDQSTTTLIGTIVHLYQQLIGEYHADLQKEGSVRKISSPEDETIQTMRDAIKESIETHIIEDIDPHLDSLKEAILDHTESVNTYYSLDLRERQITLSMNQPHLNEIVALCAEVVKAKADKHKVSDKFKPGKEVTYTLELSDKDPLDVTFGNDGGACIAVSPKTNSISNAYGLPHTIADNAQYVFNIMQQIGKGKKRRIGITYAVTTKNDNHEKVLAGNSIELSPSMNPREVLKPLVAYVEKGLETFGKREGCVAGFMSNHSFNTSQNHSTKVQEQPRFPGLLKPRRRNEPMYYSEIIKHTPVLNNEQGFFSVIDSRDGFYQLW